MQQALNKNQKARHIRVLLKEKRVFKPAEELKERSNVGKWMKEKGIKSYEELLEKAKDLEWFWGEAAKEVVSIKGYQKVVEGQMPEVKWFKGAKYNIVEDALERHKEKDKIAYIFEGEGGEVQKITYRELYVEVNKLAGGLRKLGVRKGDKVGIYLPMIPQLVIAMLACAKMGAVHAVVFSGFSAKAFEERIKDCRAKVVVTGDGFYRRGKIIPLKEQTDEALEKAPGVKRVIVYRRTKKRIPWKKGRDWWWHKIIKNQPTESETEKTKANDVLFILYTSGTTGKPKGVIQAHAGYAVGTALTLKWVFDLKEDDVWWCAADIGWITGHSYAVYAPLILGVTSVLYEGAPDYPKPDRWWKIIEKHKVTVFYTSPTAIRLFMKYGKKYPKEHNLSSLRLLGSVGEPINPEAWIWYYKQIGGKRCQIMDTWWQTETGSFVIAPLPITNLKPGSVAKPLPGFSAGVYDEKGRRIKGKGGNLVMLKPWPAMFRGLYGEEKRCQDNALRAEF